MSPYIRRYAKYLNEKALAYRTVAFDFCKVKRGLVLVYQLFLVLHFHCLKKHFLPVISIGKRMAFLGLCLQINC